MKSFLLCTLLLGLGVAGDISKSLSATCDCGWTNSGRIVGGKETRPNQYPWMVALADEDGQFCGGSIITPYHVLTAAHCVEHKRPDTVEIYIGAHNLATSNSQTVPVSKIIIHEGWAPNYDNDVAILVTSRKIEFTKFVGPACLPTAPIALDGQFIKVTGWGSMDIYKPSSDVLREVDVKVVPRKECLPHWSKWSTLKNTICVTGVKKGSCFGDSGGPLVWLDRSSNRYTQVALVSFGEWGICAGVKPTVNTDVYAFIDWINRVINRTKPGTKACSAPKKKLRVSAA